MERRGGRWSRRQLMLGTAGVGLLAGCGRLPWQAETPAKVPRLGYLSPSTPQPEDEAFQQALRDLGYVDGQNIAIEYRWAAGKAEWLSDLAAELVDHQVDILVAGTTPVIQAAKNATSAIPIVMAISADPVGTGLVASLAHPGGNITGLSILLPQLSGKRLELLKDTAPAVSRVAVLWDPALPALVQAFKETQDAARALGMELLSLAVRSVDDLDGAFELGSRGGVDALITLSPPFMLSERGRLVDLAAKSRLPVMYDFTGFVEAGGLMAYGPNFAQMYRRAAYYVDRILKGTRPADLPVEQPMTFEFVVNMKTAQALGIIFPNEIMLQVTEVIQ